MGRCSEDVVGPPREHLPEVDDDMKERLALVTESRLRYLEALVAAAAQQSASSFKLAGSVTSELSDEELARALNSIKADQLARSDAKAEEL